ncbi:MAG: prolyl oligopeptidase family serine peptidase [Steroidobacteraceae bacterium]
MVHCSPAIRHDTNPVLHFNLNLTWLSGVLLQCVSAAGLAQSTDPASLTRVDLAKPDPSVALSLPRYLDSRSTRFVDWLPDGSMLVMTRFGETTQVHRVRSALSMREQLSFESSGVIAAAAQPAHDDAFTALSARDSGRTALVLYRPKEHALVSLTDGSNRDGAAIWAHDGRRLVFSSDRSGGRDREIYLLDTGAASATPQLVAGGAGYRWQVFDWALDDHRLLLGREAASPDTDPAEGGAGELELYVANLDDAELEPLTLTRRTDNKPAPPAVPIRARTARFAPDGRGILLLSAADSAGGGFWQLSYFDPIMGEVRALSSQSGHDVELFDQSPDGHYLAYAVNDNGMSRLHLIDLLRKLEISVGAVGPGVISSLRFDATGTRLALTLESHREPPDVYVYEPETQTLTRWTHGELGLLDPERLIAPSLLHYPTWDRIDGQARMLSLYAFRSGVATGAVAPRPVLILLRSGGGAEFRPGYDALLQYLVNELGLVVLAPDVRGSSGAGRAFQALGQHELRDDAVRDVGSLLVWIGLQRELDRTRVLVMGEGYGGYLALASLAQYRDRLRGGIAAFLPHLAVLANLTSIRLPTLFVQGQANPDVPAYESEQLAARLRVNGAAVQYLAAANEAGAFRRKSNCDAYYAAVANFLAQLIR